MGLLLFLLILLLLFGGLGFVAHALWVIFLALLAVLVAGWLLRWFERGPRV